MHLQLDPRNGTSVNERASAVFIAITNNWIKHCNIFDTGNALQQQIINQSWKQARAGAGAAALGGRAAAPDWLARLHRAALGSDMHPATPRRCSRLAPRLPRLADSGHVSPELDETLTHIAYDIIWRVSTNFEKTTVESLIHNVPARDVPTEKSVSFILRELTRKLYKHRF